MKRNKKLLIIIYEDFKRKKVYVLKKRYLKYFLYIFSMTSIGFLVFFLAYLSSTVSKHSFSQQNTNVKSVKETMQNLDNETTKYFDEINKSSKQVLNFEIDKLDIKILENKMKVSFLLNNLSEPLKNTNLYLISILRNQYLMYAYPNVFVYDSNKIMFDYKLGENISLLDSKNISFNFNIFENKPFNSLTVYLYTEDGFLTFYKVIDIGAYYE